MAFIPQLLSLHLAYKVKNGMFALGGFTTVYAKGDKTFWWPWLKKVEDSGGWEQTWPQLEKIVEGCK